MPNWFAYKRISSNAVGFTTDDAQGFTTLQSNPAFALYPIAHQPLPNEFFDTADNTLKVISAGTNSINPPVTKGQAAGILKALLEDPPTTPDPWTQLQRDQCLYLILLGMFRDLKSGTVY